MKRENSYLCFQLFAGIILIAAGHVIDPLLILLGIAILCAGVIVNVIVRIQDARAERREQEEQTSPDLLLR